MIDHHYRHTVVTVGLCMLSTLANFCFFIHQGTKQCKVIVKACPYRTPLYTYPGLNDELTVYELWPGLNMCWQKSIKAHTSSSLSSSSSSAVRIWCRVLVQHLEYSLGSIISHTYDTVQSRKDSCGKSSGKQKTRSIEPLLSLHLSNALLINMMTMIHPFVHFSILRLLVSVWCWLIRWKYWNMYG